MHSPLHSLQPIVCVDTSAVKSQIPVDLKEDLCVCAVTGDG